MWQSIGSCPFQVRPLPIAVLVLCYSEWHVTCLPFSHPFIFSCSFLLFLITSTRTVISVATEPSSFAISTSWCGYATDAMPTHWTSYFQGSCLPLSVSGSWSGSMCRAHIALQELQVIAMMLHRMASHLSGKVVTLHLVISTAKAYLCNQCGTVSPFLSRLACQILNLANKPSIGGWLSV